MAVTGGEIDLVGMFGTTRAAVEVRTITGGGDPIDAIDVGKRRHVRRIAGRAGIGRVDFLGVKLESDAVEIHWLPG